MEFEKRFIYIEKRGLVEKYGDIMKIQVVLSGYGTVGREFIKLLNEKYSYIYETYGIQLVVSGVLGRNIAIHNEGGLSLHHLLMYGGSTAAIEKYLEYHRRNVQQLA